MTGMQMNAQMREQERLAADVLRRGGVPRGTFLSVNVPTGEIKGMVGHRTIRATLPDVEPGVLQRLAGVTSAEWIGRDTCARCQKSVSEW